jgi:hypothetical protein
MATNPSSDSPRVDARSRIRRSPKLRSAISNANSDATDGRRTKLLPMTDGRSATAKRFKDLYLDISQDLGGLDQLSEGQKQLIRRAAMLSAECERLEALSARGEAEFNIDTYGMLCDRLGRLFQRIGLERRSKDVTPTLKSYLEAKTEDAAEDGRP